MNACMQWLIRICIAVYADKKWTKGIYAQNILKGAILKEMVIIKNGIITGGLVIKPNMVNLLFSALNEFNLKYQETLHPQLNYSL